MANFSFPNFNVPFPYANLPAQLAASFAPPAQQFTNGSQYGRFNGVNNNAFGLFPSQWPSVFGSPVAPPMNFQPPYGNNGTLGSNQGPGSNPNGAAPATPAPPMPTGDNFGAIPKSTPAGLLNMPMSDLPPGAHVVPTSSAASGMTPAEQQARAMLSYSTNPSALYAALGQQMTARGMSQDQIAAALNSFGGTGGANGGAQLAQVRNQFGTNYGDAFANTPYAQFFANRTPAPAIGTSVSLPGLLP